MNKFVLLVIIVSLLCAACNSENETDTKTQKNNLQGQSSTETLPYFELTTSTGKITSDQLLADNRPEFLLFISPN